MLKVIHFSWPSHCHLYSRWRPLMRMKHYQSCEQFTINLSNGKELRLQSGELTTLTDGSCTAICGDASVVVTAVCKPNSGSGGGFVPFTVDYRQKAAAAGRIPTNFLRRQMAANNREILTGRMIDRSLRPRFPKGFTYDTQLMCNVLSIDSVNDHEVMAINAASAALATSNIPWNGPIGAVRVGLLGSDDQVVINPTRQEREISKLNLIVAGTSSGSILMMEGSATEPLTLNQMNQVIGASTEEIKVIINGINGMVQSIGRTKREVTLMNPSSTLYHRMRTLCGAELRAIFENVTHDKLSRDAEVTILKTATFSTLEQEAKESGDGDGLPIPGLMVMNDCFSSIFKDVHRETVLDTGIRCDGRTLTQVRPIVCQVDSWKRLHGSSMFRRGQTHVMSTVTLDSLNSVLKADPITLLMDGVGDKNFFLHYEFPPYATNEIGKVGFVSRRELGHGSLAEKSVLPLMPSSTQYPFTVMVSCEVLESSGSSSMASVCAASLSLMDAGVPIPQHVAGVAMGLLYHPSGDKENGVTSSTEKTKEQFTILTDILGLEDYCGEMDFKVAGTKTGFTALQLDVKMEQGVPHTVIMEALKYAHKAKGDIITIMNDVISSPRTGPNEKWPVTKKMHLLPHKRSRLMSNGAMNLKKVTSSTGCQVNQDTDDPNVFHIFAPNQQSMTEAESMMETMMESMDAGAESKLEFGAILEAVIIEVAEKGLLLQLVPGMDPVWLHNKELDQRKVSHPSVLGFTAGNTISVKYFGRDQVSGQIRLSRRALQITQPRTVSHFSKPKTEGLKK